MITIENGKYNINAIDDGIHTNENITVTSNKPIQGSIDSMYVQTYELTFTNTTGDKQTTKLGIRNGYKNTEIEIEGIEIK